MLYWGMKETFIMTERWLEDMKHNNVSPLSVSEPELIGLRDECLEVLRERDQGGYTEYYPPLN